MEDNTIISYKTVAETNKSAILQGLYEAAKFYRMCCLV